jgi:hypothetical protein
METTSTISSNTNSSSSTTVNKAPPYSPNVNVKRGTQTDDSVEESETAPTMTDLDENGAVHASDALTFRAAMADIYTILILLAKLLGSLKTEERKVAFETMLRMIDLAEEKVKQMKSAALKDFISAVVQSSLTIAASAFQIVASAVTLKAVGSKASAVAEAKLNRMNNEQNVLEVRAAEATLNEFMNKLPLHNGWITGVTEVIKGVGPLAGATQKLKADQIRADNEVRDAEMKFYDSLYRAAEKTMADRQAALDKVQDTTTQYTQKWNAMGLKGAEHV